MNKDSIIDYLSCILFKAVGFIIRLPPKGFSLFLGRRLGGLFYRLNAKQRRVAYSNIKTAFGSKLSPRQISGLTREFYRAFGQSFIEIFFIPVVDRAYMDKYIHFEGLEHVGEAFKKGKGVIFLGMHSGSWELSNIICANSGFPFNLFVRDLRHPRLNKLLNQYRKNRGCKIIQRKNQLRYLIDALKKNEAIGMTVDQGGKNGMPVKFFGKDASMATGAVRLSLKYGSVILPSFYARIRGPHIRTIIGAPFEAKKTKDPKKDLRDNLQEIVRTFEKNITKYPGDYLWSYKIWKYSRERSILIISDGKTGHLRQAQAAAGIVSSVFKEKGMSVNVNTVEIRPKNIFSKAALAFCSCLAGKRSCQGCLWCLRKFLQKDDYRSLISIKPDIIISCGQAAAPVNRILSKENLAKSIVVMRPSILGARRFDLAIIPRHDNPRRRKNIVVTSGALNLVDGQYLKEQSEKLLEALGLKLSVSGACIGLLIGGDAKGFCLDEGRISGVIKQIKSVSEKLGADILVTTSRRTSREVEARLKEEFQDYPRCKLLVIANEKNIPEAVGGILGLSQILIVSPESISMISEAANSGKYVVVFNAGTLGARHEKFLDNFLKDKYIHMCEQSELSGIIEKIWRDKPPVNTSKDNYLVREALKRIL
ncbi:MAG: ELM1/GtrOC1 family putative glycosyltransferase [Candidatus Omnitrophota bacterium]